jgi:hypothetical protein
MKKNVGKIDRIIRILIVIALAVLVYAKVVTGTLAIIFIVAGVVLLATSIFNTCPIYCALGWSTCKTKE